MGVMFFHNSAAGNCFIHPVLKKYKNSGGLAALNASN
jgi:hypothetical protein